MMTLDCSSQGYGGTAHVSYPEMYVADAMHRLGGFFDYAVNDYGAEGDEVADLFCMSSLSRSFEHGEPWAVAGKSGAELFACLSEELGYADAALPAPHPRFASTIEYWIGWTAAYVQWRLAITFDELFAVVPYDEFACLYYPWHEASEERFAYLVIDRVHMDGKLTPTKLVTLRKQLHLSQRELAHRSGVGLRSIQMYEQRRKDINKAQAQTLLNLSRVLHCAMEDLMEPVLSMGEAA